VQVVATYVFWIHHEEEKGIWRTDGDLDLRRFLLTCQQVGLEVLLRIGPWAHGECRNGGFPDWLQHDASIELRTDDSKYLALVEKFYANIFASAKGLMISDGGPIIGIQLENE
jgi:beta-galactosidase GanA